MNGLENVTRRIADVVDVTEHLKRSEKMTTELAEHELLADIRTFLALRKEVMERGEELKKSVEMPVVVVMDGEAFQLTRNYSSTALDELPIRVTPVTMLG